MIAIIDYGVGNSASIKNMLNRIGYESIITNKASDLESADKLILPGVGAFDAAMNKLEATGLVQVMAEQVQTYKKPLLGICLGMQLLCRGSEEGQKKGLGYRAGDVKRFELSEPFKVPHMGWNYVEVPAYSANKLCAELLEKSRFYFVHSYYVQVDDPNLCILKCDYGGAFTAAFAHDNIYGCQFHPEKSHKYGMKLLENFAGI